MNNDHAFSITASMRVRADLLAQIHFLTEHSDGQRTYRIGAHHPNEFYVIAVSADDLRAIGNQFILLADAWQDEVTG
jgi:hypothetical protein